MKISSTLFSLLSLAFVAGSPLAVASSSVQSLNKVSLDKIVIALKPDKNPEKMLAERDALAACVKERTGKAVEVIIPLSSAVIAQGMANGTIDLSYLSATDLVNAKKTGVADLLLAGEIKGQRNYPSYWVTLQGKPYASVQDLRGLKVAFASKTSTSGMTVPVYDLFKKGLISESGSPEDFFGAGNVWFGTGYVSAIERVLSGEAEAAAVSYYVLDEDKHLTAEQRAKLKKVTEQGPVPTHVVAVRASLGAEDRASLKATLLALNDAASEPLRDSVFTSKLVDSTYEEHIADLAEAIAYVSKAQ
jgi:phosphonate transport system substrate-binding protein